MNRRTFLGASMASAAAFAQGGKRLPIKKALYISMLGKEGSYEERFQRARDAGFDEIECATVESQSEAEEIKKAAEKTKLRIHSVMNQAHWKFPLSSSDAQRCRPEHEGHGDESPKCQLLGRGYSPARACCG